MERENTKNKFKVAVIGCGSVGAAAAFSMLLEGIPTELALVDSSKEKAEGLLLDFDHSLSFLPYCTITAGDDYSACADADLVVITAGARQKEGETRLDLIKKNRGIFNGIIPQIAKIAPNSILLIVTNPVDVLTRAAIELSGFPKTRVFGTGTMLDTARLRFHIGEKLGINPHSIEAYVLGEHGDSSFPVYSSANIAGKSLFDFKGFDQKTADACFELTRTAAYRIIHDIGFTSYAIGVVVREIARCIRQNSRMVVPLSVSLTNYQGIRDVCMSVPCVLDSSGIADVINVSLTKAEHASLAHSADVLRAHYL